MSEPLILVPGHMCGVWLYAPQMQVLPDTVVVDVNQDDTVEGMARRMLATAPERFHIAGLSMGGMVAMEVMALAPDRVASACLIATDPTAARPKEVEWRTSLLEQGSGSYVDTFVRQFTRHDPEGLATLGTQIRTRMGETPDPVIRAQARALDNRRAMAPLIAGFPGPVEIVCGSEDRVCPPALHEEFAEHLPNARLTVIPGCGHIVTLEKPEPVTMALHRVISG